MEWGDDYDTVPDRDRWQDNRHLNAALINKPYITQTGLNRFHYGGRIPENRNLTELSTYIDFYPTEGDVQRDFMTEALKYDENRLSGGPEFARGYIDRIQEPVDSYKFDREINTWYPDALSETSNISNWWKPRTDILLDDNHNLIMEVELPGVPVENISLVVASDHVIISTLKPMDPIEERRYHLQNERHFGNFYRKIQLPERIDTLASVARMDTGVLKVTMPLSNGAFTRPRRINVPGWNALSSIDQSKQINVEEL